MLTALSLARSLFLSHSLVLSFSRSLVLSLSQHWRKINWINFGKDSLKRKARSPLASGTIQTLRPPGGTKGLCSDIVRDGALSWDLEL